MIRNAPPKHPDSAKWYWFDWDNGELDGATIDTSAWSLPAGITMDAESASGRRVGIKLSGGTLDDEYILQNRIITSGGETLHMRVIIRIRLSGH